MRAISLVKKIEFEFAGNVSRNALTLGDVDNDGCIELVIGNNEGEVAIFKGTERLQTISDLTFIACVAVGDVKNEDKNSLVVVTADGWCYIYDVLSETPDVSLDEPITINEAEMGESIDEVDGQGQSSSNAPTTNTETQSSSESTFDEGKNSLKKEPELKNPLNCVHKQRIPANVKNIMLADVDGDGQIEMVVGLTDRVVRSYRFMKHADNSAVDLVEEGDGSEEKLLGTLVALNKWECANQIGSLTLHHSFDGQPFILVAQPGGTFMRIKCQCEDGDHEGLAGSNKSSNDVLPSSVDYEFLGISRMRNPNISTEIIGDLNSCSNQTNCEDPKHSDEDKELFKNRPYALATLDGTIMLVQDEVILWAIAVDHQIFALNKLDITKDGRDDIVVCAWDGQTYILDQHKNSVRFHLEEPVRAFHSGWYNVDVEEPAVTALVYVTFKNTIILYYDIPLKHMVCKKFEPNAAKLSELFVDKDRNQQQALEHVVNMDKRTKRELVEYLLYDAR
ncbi:hypothetical protein HUJ04_000695 [Dendroctonus ponderosae]|uniref:Integrin-alpha FG-GAP repeat-containing protein 2 n=1 Tax=Dendroctonus ponderosae TaxID=77166 RepID=A0AAR5PLX3_DENPD|nr:hypothetical protein HUJ04_000695 [Dendroctonus ponderosae]